MAENIIKTFKLNYDGTFDEVDYDHIKEVFTIVNILAIYITKIKTMYIWIGRNATQALKNHIPNIRVIIKEEFPQLRIIRNITFDMRSESFEFFNNLNLSKDELYEIIKYQEKTVIPILEKVDDLKEKSGALIKSEEYKRAIDILKEIIELANKIQDDALATEQRRILSELTGKIENQQIVSEIEQETARIEKEYNDLIKANKLFEAHNLVETYIKKYEMKFDLSLIESAKELILKEKRKWNSEQEKIKNDLLSLEQNFSSAIENLDVSEAVGIFEKGSNLLINLIDDKIKNRWKQFNKKIQHVREKLRFIEEFEHFSEEISKLKESHQYNELGSKIKDLIKQVESIDLPEYRSKLDVLRNEFESAEEIYKKTLDNIYNLERIIEVHQKHNKLEDILRDCEKIIELARSLNIQELIEKYTKFLELTKKHIKERKEFEERQKKITVELSKLEKSFIMSLKTMELKNLDNLIEKATNLLSELVDDGVKKKWEELKVKFASAKHLLESIKQLSKKGMEALYTGSCTESLESFEQIIIQLQEYKN